MTNINIQPLTLTTLTPTDDTSLPRIDCWMPFVAPCWTPQNTLTTPPACWTCGTHQQVLHREWRDALEEYELTCDACHKEEYPEQYLTTPPPGAKKRAWISSGLKKEGEKVWRSLASDEDILKSKPTWKPLNEFK